MQAIGRYELLHEVARGGMGVVYRACDPEGRAVAIKLLLAGADASEHQQRRFRREVQALLVLRHSHVVQLLDAGVERGYPWLAMEWIEGDSLATQLAREGVLDPRDAAELVAKLARALEYCHAQGVVHRDVKPDNVLLRADGEPLLTDFGLVGDAEEDGRSRLTRDGAFLGTPGYWSPEQARGQLDRIGPQSDVWGLGALLHALLTGEPPLRVNNLAEVLTALERPPPPPSSSRPGISRALDAVCRRCLMLEPEARYPGAGALAEDLERWLAGKTPLAAQGRGGGRWLLLLGVLTAAVGLGVLAARRGSAPPARPGSGTPATVPSTAAARSPSQEQRELHERAKRRLDERDAEGALADLRRLELLRPRDPEVQLGLVAAHLLRSELEPARLAAERALALDPRSGRVWLGVSVMRARVKDFAGARVALLRSLALDPLNARAWDNYAVLLGEEGQLPAALQAVEWALRLEPDSAPIITNRGALHYRAGDHQAAERDLARALELDPRNAEAWSSLVAMRAERGDLSAALSAAEQAVALDPYSANAWLNRGAVRGRQGDLEGAVADYRRATELDPRDPVVCTNLAGTLERLGRPVEALTALERFLEVAADTPAGPELRRRAEALRARLEAPR